MSKSEPKNFRGHSVHRHTRSAEPHEDGDEVSVAVALRYDGTGAPRVAAKGRNDIAQRILAIAEEHGLPLYKDAELTGLLAQVELGDEVPSELYVAVAQVLAFAYFVSGKYTDGQTA